jgi:GNAT superfamily N-acetyltransferase
MIHEIEPGAFQKVGYIFEGHKQNIPVFAVIDGNFPGRVFVDNHESPKAALVWALSRWAYVGGDGGHRAFTRALTDLVRDTIIPCSLEMEQRWFELYTPNSEEWTKVAEGSLAPFKPHEHYESVYVLDKLGFMRSRTSPVAPEGSYIETAEIPILSERARRSAVVAAEFKAKTAFGFRLMRSGEMLALCRSNGFSSGREFMIDVITVNESERGRGYATIASTALIDFCLEEGYVPLWETTEDNVPSQKLARRLGFVEDESYPVYAIEF